MNLITSLQLLYESPKDFIYAFTYPAHNQVELHPYDPNSGRIARKIISGIKQLCPFLKIYYFGSSRLHILGNRDIDLYITCPSDRFAVCLPVLESRLGKPRKIKGRDVEWLFYREGFSVEISMIDPQTKKFRDAVKINTLLKSNKSILQSYKTLKESLNGKSSREYVLGRMKFFNRLLREEN